MDNYNTGWKQEHNSLSVSYLTTLSVVQTIWTIDCLMNRKGYSRKWSWPMVLSRHLPGWTKKKYKKPQSGEPFSGLRFEPGTFCRIQNRKAGTTTTRPRRSEKMQVTLDIRVFAIRGFNSISRASTYFPQSITCIECSPCLSGNATHTISLISNDSGASLTSKW